MSKKISIGWTMGTSSKELARKLRKLAGRQHGCFTAAQALETGYADSVHLYHVKNGEWIRVFRGIYRLAHAQETPAARCMAALLWTRDKTGKIKGILASETAEALRSDTLIPSQPVQILVPKGFRRSSETPNGMIISIVESKQHKPSKIGVFSVQTEAQQTNLTSATPSDTPDYYDWLDYQAVLCEKSS